MTTTLPRNIYCRQPRHRLLHTYLYIHTYEYRLCPQLPRLRLLIELLEFKRNINILLFGGDLKDYFLLQTILKTTVGYH